MTAAVVIIAAAPMNPTVPAVPSPKSPPEAGAAAVPPAATPPAVILDQTHLRRRPPHGALRVALALAAAIALAWCAWQSLRTGASRMISDYAERARVPAAAYSASLLTPSDPEAHYALAGLLADEGDSAGALRAYERAAGTRALSA